MREDNRFLLIVLLLGTVLIIIVAVIWNIDNSKPVETQPPKEYLLEYIVDTLSSVCIVIIHQQETPIGITEVDCILVPAGRFKVIEEGSYVGK